MNKWMAKSYFTLFLSLIFFVNVSIASDKTAVDKKIVEAISISYFKSEAFKKLKDYLNENPGIVGSSMPNLGSEVVGGISTALSIITMITAKTDKERLYAAAGLYVTPEPVSAAILIAIQLFDMVKSAEHQADMISRYAEIKKILMKTQQIKIQLKQIEVEEWLFTLEQFCNNLKDLANVQSLMNSSELVNNIDNPDILSKLSESQINDFLDGVIKFKVIAGEIDRMSWALQEIDFKIIKQIDREKINQTLASIRSQQNGYDLFEKNIKFFLEIIKNSNDEDLADKKIEDYQSKLNEYLDLKKKESNKRITEMLENMK